MTIPFHVPTHAEIGPIRRIVSTEAERKQAVDHIIREARGNLGDFAILNALYSLGYAYSEIGGDYLMARVDEARESGRVG